MTEPPLREPVEVIHAGVLGDVPHGFLGRRGGVSSGWAAGLNAGLGSGDVAELVARNRALAVEAVLPASRLVGLHQIHSAECVTVTEPWGDEARPRADALVTDRPGVLLGILTADCAPVLLADPEAGVVGAAHAGWRGALAGVTDRTIAAMAALGARPSAIVATIGPCIGQDSYEVDEAFRDRFLDAHWGNARFFTPGRPGHTLFDLPAYVAARLAGAGVARIEALGLDTYSAPERFFSFRRATHCGEPAYGRQISLIGLAATA